MRWVQRAHPQRKKAADSLDRKRTTVVDMLKESVVLAKTSESRLVLFSVLRLKLKFVVTSPTCNGCIFLRALVGYDGIAQMFEGESRHMRAEQLIKLVFELQRSLILGAFQWLLQREEVPAGICSFVHRSFNTTRLCCVTLLWFTPNALLNNAP